MWLLLPSKLFPVENMDILAYFIKRGVKNEEVFYFYCG